MESATLVQPFVATTFSLWSPCVLLVFLASTLLIYFLFSDRERLDSEPPLVPGKPIIGNGPQFQKNAVEFLLDSRKKFGDLFTIKFPGIHINMLMNPHYVSDFSKVKAFDFAPIHKQVTTNVFSFEMPNSHKMLRNAAKAARAALNEDVFRYQGYVEESFNNKAAPIQDGSWQTEALDTFLGDTQFRAIFNGIFGRSDESAFNHTNAKKLFGDIHSSFNYVWLGFPIWMFPKTSEAWKIVHKAHPDPEELLARDDCSSYIKNVMQTMKDADQPLHSMIGHNMVYLHVNYNTKKASYWAINNLLKNPEALKALQEEVDNAIARNQRSEETTHFSQTEIDALPLLDSFIKETFRLCSGVFMIREITEDTKFHVEGKDYLMRKGDKIAVYPPALHRDPEVYDKPNEFIADRFIEADFQFRNKEVTKPILPYGVLCPGQKLSMIQFKWFLFSLIAKFDLKSNGEFAEYDFNSYGHEILPPVRDIDFQYKLRESNKNVSIALS